MLSINELLDDIDNNTQIIQELLNKYNNTPEENLLYYPANMVLCKNHKNAIYCYKCTLAHDENHDCYLYDRIITHICRHNNYYPYNDFIYSNDWGEPTVNGRYGIHVYDAGCMGKVFDYLTIDGKVFKLCQECDYMKQV
jgi:hypothetical protein